MSKWIIRGSKSTVVSIAVVLIAVFGWLSYAYLNGGLHRSFANGKPGESDGISRIIALGKDGKEKFNAGKYRIARLRQYGIQGRKEAIPELVKALDSNYPPTVYAASMSLARLNATKAQPDIKRAIKRLSHEDLFEGEEIFPYGIRAASARLTANRYMGNPDMAVGRFLGACGMSARSLRKTIERDDHPYGVLIYLRGVAELLTEMRKAGADEDRLRRIESRFPFDADYAASLRLDLGKMADKRARVRYLLGQIKLANMSGHAEQFTVQALADEADQDTVPMICDALRHSDKRAYMRSIMLIRALAAIGDQSAIPAIQPFTKDDNRFVRADASRAIRSLKAGAVNLIVIDY